MKNEISLLNFSSNLDLVNTYMNQALVKNLRMIEYDDHGNWTRFFILDKESASNRFEAFIILYAHVLHFGQGWKVTDTSKEDVTEMIQHLVIPELDSYLFQKLTLEELERQLSRVGFDKAPQGQKKEALPLSEGYFCLKQKEVPINNSPVDFEIQSATGAILFRDDWDDLELFFETPKDYIFLLWWVCG